MKEEISIENNQEQLPDQYETTVNQSSFFYQNTNNWDSEEVAQSTDYQEYDNNLH